MNRSEFSIWAALMKVAAMKKGGNPTETVGNALEAECYSEASSDAVISLFLISITSLIYRAGDGDRTRDV